MNEKDKETDSQVSSKKGFERASGDSTPVWSTELEALLRKASSLYLNFPNQEATPQATLKEPHLVIPHPDSKDQRWFIKFYVFDENTGKKRVKKLYRLKGKTPKEKREYAAEMIAYINKEQSKGKLIRVKSTPKVIEELTVKKAINDCLREKRNTRSYGSRLNTYYKPYSDFCIESKAMNVSVVAIDHSHAEEYLQWLKDKGYGNRTINNYMSYAKNVWNRLVDKDVVIRSPFSKIKPLKNGLGKNIAFLPKQLIKLKSQHDKYPDLGFLARFMYYTLARTNELAQLKVEHIGMYHPDQLYIPAENSKNGFERHIIIPEPLMEEIIERGILQNPDNYYVFSCSKVKGNTYKELKPYPHQYRTANIGNRYREYILNPLGFSKDYTLYSWKHTGVINAHRMGVSDADIMQQTGHRSYESFTKYMKSLGMFSKGEFAAKIPRI